MPRQINTMKKPHVTVTQIGKQFCQETALHGFHFIGDKRLGHVLSAIWFGICSLGVLFSVILIHMQWTRFQSSPTVMGIETTNHPIADVPFPAVTICNLNKVYQPATENIKKKLLEYGFEPAYVNNYLHSLSTLITNDPSDFYENITDTLQQLGYNPESLMYELSQPCDHLIAECRWIGKFRKCPSIFRTTKSSIGFCCSFNYDMYNETMQKNPQEYSAKYVSGAGMYISLHVTLNVEPTTYYASSEPFYGAQVLIHDWTEYPELLLGRTLLQPGQRVAVVVTPTVLESSDDIRNLEISQRQCLFSDEVYLRTSITYSYGTCLTECRIVEVHNLCGCIPFYYPNIYNVRQCVLSDNPCLLKIKEILYSLQPSNNTHGFSRRGKIGLNCSCYPACADRLYRFDTLIGDASYGLAKLHRSNTDMQDMNSSILTVYFEELTCLKYRRDALMTWDSLLASFGGLFGLCVGGSIVSLIEISHYCIKYVVLRYFTPVKKLQRVHVKPQHHKIVHKNLISNHRLAAPITLYRPANYM